MGTTCYIQNTHHVTDITHNNRELLNVALATDDWKELLMSYDRAGEAVEMLRSAARRMESHREVYQSLWERLVDSDYGGVDDCISFLFTMAAAADGNQSGQFRLHS